MTKVPFAIGRSGYRPVYRPNEINHCPGCGNSQWMVGRSTAECAFCATAMPLIEAGMSGTGLWHSYTPFREAPLAA